MKNNMSAKMAFIERTWNLWQTMIGNQPTWYLSIQFFPPNGKREDHRFAGASKEECLRSAVEELDQAVRDWAFNPDANPFGRWLVMEKGWRL